MPTLTTPMQVPYVGDISASPHPDSNFFYHVSRSVTTGSPIAGVAMRISTRFMHGISGVVVIVATLATPVRTAAQVDVRISSEPYCPQCSIGVAPIARIGTMADPFSIHTLTRATADESGRVYFAPLHDAGKIGVFDLRTGQTRLFGRPGEGPGEFSFVFVPSIGQGDTLFAFEFNRFTVLSPDQRVTAVRSVPLRARHALVLDDGNLLLNAHFPTRGGEILPLHVVDRNGRIVRSFGQEGEGSVRITNAAERMAYEHGATAERALAHSSAGRFWTGSVLRYELELWNSRGDRLRRINRNADWYPPRTRPSIHSSWEKPPDPMIVAVRQDSEERLWVAVSVADANWREQDPSEFSPARTRDTIIEVLDLNTMRLVASKRLDGVVTDLLADGMMVTREDDASGLLYLQLWRLALHDR